jgi:hypothetical protein
MAVVIRKPGSEISDWARTGMRSKYDHIKVEVENSSESGMRTYSVTLKAPEKDFELTDQLTQRKVIDSFDSLLRQALKEATKSYLNSAESLLSLSLLADDSLDSEMWKRYRAYAKSNLNAITAQALEEYHRKN